MGENLTSRAEINRMYQTLKNMVPARGLQPETAEVYRGGGRLWFTKAAAEKAEARKLLKTRCECCDGDWQTPPYTCLMHRDPARFERMIRLTVSMVVRRTASREALSHKEPS